MTPHLWFLLLDLAPCAGTSSTARSERVGTIAGFGARTYRASTSNHHTPLYASIGESAGPCPCTASSDVRGRPSCAEANSGTEAAGLST
jgi:hypothetical protein